MSSNYEQIRSILSQMSGHDRIITVPKMYVEMTGDLAEAILLNQIIFYSDKTKRTDGYFYKKHQEWTEEICLTERQIRHATKKLKAKELIETKVMKANGAPTTHYKPLFDNIVKTITTLCSNRKQQNVVIENDIMSQSITEITTEITTDNNIIDSAPVSNHKNVESETAFKFYELNGFGLLTPHVADMIGAWIDDTNEALVLHALKLAAENNVLRWNYAEAILRSWYGQKLTTVEQVQAMEAQHKARKGEQQRGQTSRRNAEPGKPNRDYDGLDF